jgi:hypothetical protein
LKKKSFSFKEFISEVMSTDYNLRRMPSSWGIMVTVLLILGGMSLLVLGSILYASPTATRQPLIGVSLLLAGGVCFVIFAMLLLPEKISCFHPQKRSLLQGTEPYSL